MPSSVIRYSSGVGQILPMMMMTVGIARHGAELQLHPGGAVADPQLRPGHQAGGQ